MTPYKYHLKDGGSVESEAMKASFDNVLRENWQEVYFEAIKKALGESDKTLIIPSSASVLRLLREADIAYLLCYPQNTEESKEEYRRRFLARGNTEDFIHIFIDGWDVFFSDLENDQYGEHVIMSPNQYLSDVIRTDVRYYR